MKNGSHMQHRHIMRFPFVRGLTILFPGWLDWALTANRIAFALFHFVGFGQIGSLPIKIKNL
jgi:hypothetical protein